MMLDKKSVSGKKSLFRGTLFRGSTVPRSCALDKIFVPNFTK